MRLILLALSAEPPPMTTTTPEPLCYVGGELMRGPYGSSALACMQTIGLVQRYFDAGGLWYDDTSCTTPISGFYTFSNPAISGWMELVDGEIVATGSCIPTTTTTTTPEPTTTTTTPEPTTTTTTPEPECYEFAVGAGGSYGGAEEACAHIGGVEFTIYMDMGFKLWTSPICSVPLSDGFYWVDDNTVFGGGGGDGFILVISGDLITASDC